MPGECAGSLWWILSWSSFPFSFQNSLNVSDSRPGSGALYKSRPSALSNPVLESCQPGNRRKKPGFQGFIDLEREKTDPGALVNCPAKTASSLQSAGWLRPEPARVRSAAPRLYRSTPSGNETLPAREHNRVDHRTSRRASNEKSDRDSMKKKWWRRRELNPLHYSSANQRKH